LSYSGAQVEGLDEPSEIDAALPLQSQTVMELSLGVAERRALGTEFERRR
jgi:hypothetical protein